MHAAHYLKPPILKLLICDLAKSSDIKCLLLAILICLLYTLAVSLQDDGAIPIFVCGCSIWITP